MAVRATNIILTGFMGSGKTVVGRALARKLGWRFVDLDRLVANKAGKSVRRIFQEKGEAAFRKMERQAIRGLASFNRHVVATGGGAPVFPGNRRLFRKAGIVVYLSAPAVVLARRLARVTDRPLLASARGHPAALRALIGRMLRKRAGAYATADLAVNAGIGRPPAVAKRVMAGLRGRLAGKSRPGRK